ncbi:MAG TPA: sulfatase-like hydrolase/transferase [Baekduia sp.]|uniref:sulfatase-like hydrolase/transferase n=1 Tax=Baekduia sp. TaxID=2600305 RepID=UPI002D76D2D9|nr:sulfatase-like hydrolase/transferase [Baekduia sp.]HET6506606.1 sulfatase-like hydrolase/transferase [Baekduia sp.]
MAGQPFNGVINLDVRDSTPDWTPYLPQDAPEGAPNVLVVLYDDTGLAAWSPYGGGIEMPTMQRLADGGLTYSQWHTTALCSPTRSCFLTGRNHHTNGFACITEGAIGYPGGHARLPESCAPLAKVLQRRGWNTFWIGKNHNVPSEEVHAGAPKRYWPLAQGFDRFYGFLGGETNQWYPTLVEDNHFIDQPALPQDGYHLSKDLADQALSMLRDTRQSAPSRPWFMWFCPGANHAPHHAPQEYIDKYKGKFDSGYEAYREWVLPRMVQRGIVPEGTELTPLNPMPEGTHSPLDDVRPWAELDDDEKRLFARMAEVYAGFSEYTDAQVGRIVDHLEQTGQLDNTIILYCADNGASGEGSPNGSVNENKFFNGFPDEMADNLAHLDDLGSPNTYNHYPTGWAAAFSTPFKMFKRYSYAGGTCDPLVIHWPAGIRARGEVRTQYHHVTDVVPTLLDCLGLGEFPAEVGGVAQEPQPGVSMRYTFDDAAAPSRKDRQYYAMLGTRGIYADGWKAVAVHGPTSGLGHFDQDAWELYHLAEDYSEARDLAAELPDKLKELVGIWFEEAEKYDVLPLDDRRPAEILGDPRPQPEPPRDTYIYFPETAEVPEAVAPNIRGRSYRILAEVEIATPEAGGVLFAQGSRFGGHALFLRDRKLHYVYNFLGIPPEQVLVGDDPVAPGRHVLGVAFDRRSTGEHGETHGTATLYVDDRAVAQEDVRTQISNFNLCGDGLCVGRDSSDAVTALYTAPAPFAGGRILQVEVALGDDQYIDLERTAEAMLARE